MWANLHSCIEGEPASLDSVSLFVRGVVGLTLAPGIVPPHCEAMPCTSNVSFESSVLYEYPGGKPVKKSTENFPHFLIFRHSKLYLTHPESFLRGTEHLVQKSSPADYCTMYSACVNVDLYMKLRFSDLVS